MSNPPIHPSLLYEILGAGSLTIHIFRGRLSPGRNWQIQRRLETHLLYVLLEGGGTLSLDEENHSLSSPCAVLLPQRTSYTLTTDPQAPLVFYPIHFTTAVSLPHHTWEQLRHIAPTEITPLLELILSLWQTETQPGQAGAAAGLKALLTHLKTLQQAPEERSTHHQGITRVCDYLRNHPEKRASVTELARMAGMGRSSFSHHFTQTTGLSPRQYAIRERCRRAEVLMREEGFQVGEAAMATGYSDSFSFSKQFKAVMGVPPSEASR